MKKSLALVGLGCLTLFVAASSLSAAPAARPLAAHQEPRGIGQLVARGDRVDIAYGLDSGASRSVQGFLYVRNDRQRRFQRLTLKPVGRPANGLHVQVPGRLIRGQRLLYYAVLRDTRSGRSVTLPRAGARRPQSASILQQPFVVRLGTHQFGQMRGPGVVVARARADEVGWQIPPPGQGPHFGPQTFLVGGDGSIWLHDVNDRMLGWDPGRPDGIVHTVPLPYGSTDHDVALGPAGTMYVTRVLGHGLNSYMSLFRLSATGEVMWQSRLGGEYSPDAQTFALGSNSSLRYGPDGNLYCLVWMSGLPGGEWGWMPVATPDGRAISPAEQRRRTKWPYQPVAGGLRLLSEVYTPPNAETAPHEARFALIDRRGRVARAWRVLSRTDINLNLTTPELVGGDPVVVLDATHQRADGFDWEYVVLRLGPAGVRESFSLPRAVYGDNILADVRIGPDGALYQLASSPTTGVEISRYSLDSGRP